MYQIIRATRAIAALALAAAIATPAAAGPYLAAGVGRTGFETLCSGDGCERRDSGWRIAAGWQLDSRWSFEALYLDAGRFVASDVTTAGAPFHGTARVRVTGATAGFDLPLGTGFAFGPRVGIASVRADFTPGPAPAIGGGRTTTQFLGGLTARWQPAGRWALRLDWDHTRGQMNRYSGDVNAVTLGAQVRF